MNTEPRFIVSLDSALDTRDPDPSREGIFLYHNCSVCRNGAKPCTSSVPGNCGNPIARND